MTDYSIKKILIISLIIFLIINAVGLIVGGIIFHGYVKEIQTQLKDTNDLLDKLNSNIQGLDKLNGQIDEIKGRIKSIEESVGLLINNTGPIETINTNLLKVKQELEHLNQECNQTLIINDVTQEELNKAINSAVDIKFSTVNGKINFNFILNIIFGSLLSIGFGIYLYFIFKKEKDEGDKDGY